jgi:DNA processing protein
MAQEIFPDDEKYPKLLKEALGSLSKNLGPKKLYYKGNWDEFFPPEAGQPGAGENCLAVIGSRHLTSYGRRITEQLVTQIAYSGITIVSGFMYGGDEAAHKATVRAGQRTIAVMPCGIDRIHPEYQADLYNDILKNNGLIVSEYEGDFQPQTWTYVQRNRIVAGLSKAILVVEAGLNSGSLITAGYSKDFGRKVFALPGQITSEVSKGTNKLIKEGAELVTCAEDILNFFKASSPVIARSHQATRQSSLSDPLEQKIIDQLKRESMDADTLARTLEIPASKLGTTLTMMQLKNIISQESGKYYVN